MTELLAAIETALAEKRPAFAQSLRPPLPPERIAELEQAHGVILPEDVRALYRWRDGQDPRHSGPLANNMMFQPLEEALDVKTEFDGMIGYDFELENWWRPEWLPLFHNGGGDYLVVDMAGVHTGQAGQLLTFYHDRENRPIIAPDLETFLRAVRTYYETMPPREMDDAHSLGAHLACTGQSFKAAGEAQPLE